MAMKFNKGGRDVSPDNSTIGVQINDRFWSRAAIKEAAKKKTFSQLGDKLTQPKHFGDKIVKYHEFPILHESNINDQGIDANGVKMIPTAWYAYDANGNRIITDADVDPDGAGVNQGYSTKAAAWTKADAAGGTIKSGQGNLFGGSKDILVQDGSFPVLSENGGIVNGVGIVREMIEADIQEFGAHMTFTKRSLEMDTEKGLLARYSQAIGEMYGDVREAQIRNSLLGQSAVNRVFAGAATAMNEVDDSCLMSFTDLRRIDKSLNDARCPTSTKLIDGSTKYGTTTVGKARYVYVGNEARPTLEDMEHNGRSVWDPVEDYAAAGTIAEQEIGRIGRFRFIEDENMPNYSGQGKAAAAADPEYANTYKSIGADGNEHYDVFPVLFVGSGSFATIGFEGDVARVTTVMPKPDAHNDVYGKKGAVSISWYYGIMFLRPEWIRQIATVFREA